MTFLQNLASLWCLGIFNGLEVPQKKYGEKKLTPL